jgi:hypothetical protein
MADKTTASKSLIVVIAICACSSFAQSAQAKTNGWIVERYDQFAGKGTVRCSELGYSSVSANIGYDTVCSPPTWCVSVKNAGKKLYFVASNGTQVKHFTGFALLKSISTRVTVDDLKWQRAYSTTFLGHPIAVWRGSTGKTVSSTHLPAPKFEGFEYWAAEDIPIPASVASFNHTVHGWPIVKLLPMRYLRYQPRQKVETILETESIKRADLPAVCFQIPKDYKLAKNEAEVATNTQNLQWIFEGLDTKPEKRAH